MKITNPAQKLPSQGTHPHTDINRHQYASIHNTHQHTSIHINTHNKSQQHTSVHQYTTASISSHEYESYHCTQQAHTTSPSSTHQYINNQQQASVQIKAKIAIAHKKHTQKSALHTHNHEPEITIVHKYAQAIHTHEITIEHNKHTHNIHTSSAHTRASTPKPHQCQSTQHIQSQQTSCKTIPAIHHNNTQPANTTYTTLQINKIMIF